MITIRGDKRKIHTYTAYGLNIHSDLALPELIDGGEGEADIVIGFGKVKGLPKEPTDGTRYFYVAPGEVYITLSGVGKFLVRGGQETIIDPLPGVDDRIFRLYILGTVLGILLCQRGLSVFHASAVTVTNGAVAFLGEKGHGKSTIAASLHVRGHDLIADDIIVIDEVGAQLMVRPGFPQFKLWPDSLGAIGETSESLPVLHPNFEKRSRHVSREFATKPIPLRCVFLLDFGEEIEISRLGPNEGLIAIMPHWYGARFNGELLPVLGLETHFRECANIVKKVPIYVLKRPRSLRFITDVAQMIERTQL